MIDWNFDQGRLDYFQFDELKKIACALAQMDGMKQPVRRGTDTVRKILKGYSDLPFSAPSNYFVWRNYGRVFECQLLATANKGHILATDLCKKIASDPDSIDPDDYFSHFARNFYYSSPIFSGYSTTGQQAFPVVAIIKFLISQKLQGKSYITIDEIISHLISNSVTGLESIAFYSKLAKNTPTKAVNTRQLRELVIFISQFSFLKWDNPKLYIEIESKDELLAIENSLKPVLNLRNGDAALEILAMGSGFGSNTLGNITLNQISSTEEEFTEGSKIRVTHLRTERSSKLKALYFKHTSQPEVCRSCSADTARRYPWASHVIELHHLLPLSSPVRVEKGTTSLKDLVGLCPSCHRATHLYYSTWFKKRGVKDFSSYTEAVGVFHQAKSQIVLP